MADIKTITLPTGTTYNIVDQGARDLISALNNLGWTLSTNASTTPQGVTWTPKGQTTKITGTLVASASTVNSQYLVYKGDNGKDTYDEYITVKTGTNTYQWERLGSTDVQLGDLGRLAFVDSASGDYSYRYPNKMTGSYQPQGSNAKSAVTISPTTTDVYSMSSAGSVTAGSSASCTLPSLTTNVSNGNLTIGWSAGSFTANTPTAVTLPGRSSAIKAWTGYNSGVNNTYADAQAFSGTSKTITVNNTANNADYTTETGTVTVAPALSE